ncbi:putative acetyltransferase [Yersinia frederiksenii]|uniref:PanD regulatory factor n=2 Tax=Yersinia frederiksenii TaxID=29484 RepID=A0A380PWH8_YERFR|nr:aspartate 1-decarboxylase autocleavage activator PanM [Yersinia frederiksenii]ATM97623.1 aspartate 1-decarboxylase autocleavage activator PanM [Yersinia frederiksenii]EEQ14212.1 Acetyltransferase [Yersinia frederiksenii ATCC 33641]KGA46859.1 acetyltransferase domain protein [Yersinia frederiksenii ATCC 33641]MDN0119099.1 aspartate 1-decarboxylase autocleavage activator PanM [Yersinia frederiksenii]CFR11379.1 putative acetyltransferase [Yersinia frederiksenii]
MKLTIERLTILTHQDLIDLAKIWPAQQPALWQQWIQDGKPLFAARFNERLLGAVKIRVDGEQAELQDLWVREVTRRRGVGLYLIEETLRQLPAIKHWHLSDEQVTIEHRAAMDGFMHANGFTRSTRGWQRQS